jgi:uncharacterized protein YjiK
MASGDSRTLPGADSSHPRAAQALAPEGPRKDVNGSKGEGLGAEPLPRGAKAERESKRDRKLRRKAERLIRDARRPLDSWERYRALVDALEEANDLVDLADHKARFALVIMGAINVVVFFLATRTDSMGGGTGSLLPWLGVFMVIYALVSVYYFLQAIESLRPRRPAANISPPAEGGLQEHPVGLRFYEEALRREIEDYRAAWRDVRIGQLNAEIAIQIHIVSGINRAKYAALQRLYRGLQILTLMAAALISAEAFSLAEGKIPSLSAPKLKAGKPSRGGLNILGTPERITTSGVKEASGIAYHAKLDRLFVVGDTGRLAELDPEGRLVASDKIGGNLEDVTVHTPTGNLLLVSEKKSELILWDPMAHRELRRWHLDPAIALGEQPGDRNQGFEGLAFREDASKPSGGVLYITHQRSPPALLEIAFDLDRPSGELGAEVILSRWNLAGREDLTAVAYFAARNRVLVLSDAEDRILVMGGGAVDETVVLPGLQQEGLAFDGRGALWVADDRAGLLRFDGAQKALFDGLQQGR